MQGYGCRRSPGHLNDGVCGMPIPSGLRQAECRCDSGRYNSGGPDRYSSGATVRGVLFGLRRKPRLPRRRSFQSRIPIHFVGASWWGYGRKDLANDNNGVDPTAGEKDPMAVALSYEAANRVNFASAQNDVAIIERLVIDNPSSEPLTDVRLTLRSAPPIIREKVWTVDRIASESAFALSDISTPLDIERLAGLDEAEVGELEFRVEAHGVSTIVEKCRIDLLARDEWGGVRDMAQILAAFVSPNDPAVAGVVKDAARLLGAAGHDGSMNGYQSEDPRRAYLLAAAIWSSVTGLGLTYAEPPASFEREGQKVRGPGRITNEGLATCLDSTLFLAAAFEAAGLHPVVLFAQGHAWLGVWLCKKDFGHVTEPDVVAVRKSVQAHEFVPIETTLLTRRPSIGFDQAVDEGRRRLSENRDPEFVMAVDIARSRAARIRPLASHKPVESVGCCGGG